jgi:cystathionine beta-synthase
MRPDYKSSLLELIGSTPLVKLNRIAADVKPLVLAKLEYLNPGGSVKDRIAWRMVEAAEKEGLLRPGGTIVEATSGNTGFGLALVAAIRGYRLIITMPDKMSREKIQALRAMGAEVLITPTHVPPDSPESYYQVARRIASEIPGAFLANQYFNPQNPEAHYLTTGPEIWEQTGGKVDVFVAGIGTGGTISGVGRYLKEKNPDVRVIGVDPEGSILREYFQTGKLGEARPYKVEGIGEDLVPDTFHPEYIDEIVTVGDRESFLTARRLAREEGMFVGGSSGTAAYAALQIARQLDEEKTVVVLFPDGGSRYLSTFYSDEWMRQNRFLEPEKITLQDLLEAKSRDIPALVALGPEQPVREAITLMRRYEISQLPVLENGRSAGCVEEGTLLSQVLENEQLLDRPVRSVMAEPLPVLDAAENVGKARSLLAGKAPAVLVGHFGRIIGIVAKSDLIEFFWATS